MAKKHIAAIIGGACAGSEAAFQLSSQGVEVVIFEQNALPYGKIEDGLPRWHSKLQTREKKKIDEKLSHELVHFVPHCQIGKDTTIQGLLDIGFSTVILANGAWRDRPLRATGLDDVKNLTFCYQNAFIYWFNHYHEPNYSGPIYPVTEGAVILGGGLASIDVIKVCQLETALAKLKEMGIKTDVCALEHKGIPKFLEQHNLKYEDLKIEPARLYYRRRVIDMPLASTPENCTPEKLEKTQKVRTKIIDNAERKYCFTTHPLRVAKSLHSENGNVTGVTFFKNEYDGVKLSTTEEEEYVKTSLVVSSIGSIPEPITGLPMVGETYDLLDWVTGTVKSYSGVYGVGNAITGKGNIQVSYKHAKYMGKFVADSLTTDEETLHEEKIQGQTEQVAGNMKEIFEYLSQKPEVSEQSREAIFNQIKEWHKKSEYGDYIAWRDNILKARGEIE